ncbi:hypothetical protein ACIHFC_36790 [Streptomyces sp. NPDC052013]|uniref:hypothetical protein n=1 Tax=Streptomyces sp. NPDC052013 TaxID=3365679 RepID=UPI0037D4DB21
MDIDFRFQTIPLGTVPPDGLHLSESFSANCSPTNAKSSSHAKTARKNGEVNEI